MTAEELVQLLENMMNQLPGEGQKIMREEITSRIRTADSTGALANSVTGVRSGSTVVISANTPYATYFEDGRGSFGPRYKKWLHWDSPSYGEIFTKRVGPMKAAHFAEPTAERIVQFIESFN